MLVAGRSAGMTSRAELANFMAQISAESRNLSALEESFHYSRGIDQIPVRWARRQGDEVLENARREAVQGRPDVLAELMYGERMGNSEPGDGYRYRGRGYIQLTGRDNYRAMGEALDLDLERCPELAAEPGNAARIAVAFWQQHVPVAEREDVPAATRRINGGTNGLAHRQAQYERWHAALTPEFLVEIDASLLEPATRHAIPTPATLRIGSRGEDVAALQRDLDRLGIRDGQGRPLAADGIFGANTRQAVENFQLWSGLDATGTVDRQTRDLLRDPRDPAHPDHAMYARIRAGVRAVDENLGKPYDEASERISRCLLARCKGASAGPDTDVLSDLRVMLRRVDHVVMGGSGHLFAIEGALDDPAQRRVRVPFADAARVPVEESDRSLAAGNAAAIRERERDRHHGPHLQPRAPGHDMPGLALQ